MNIGSTLHFLCCIDGTTIFNTRKTVEATVLVKGGVSQVYIPCPANIAKLNATILRVQEVTVN
jgi:hypothetical protein